MGTLEVYFMVAMGRGPRQVIFLEHAVLAAQA